MAEIIHTTKLKKEKSLLPLALIGAGGLGAYLLYDKYLGKMTNPNSEFDEFNLFGGSDASGQGRHNKPIVYKSQVQGFEDFEQLLREYDNTLDKNFEGQIPDIFTYNGFNPYEGEGYVLYRDLKNRNYDLHVATQSDWLHPLDSEILLSVLAHENAHAQYTYPDILDYMSYDYIEINDIGVGGGVGVEGNLGFLILYDTNPDSLDDVILNSTTFLELGAEYMSTYMIDQVHGDGVLTLDDFLKESIYNNEVELFQQALERYDADIEMNDVALALADAMIQENSIEVFVDDMVNGFEVNGEGYGGFGGNEELLEQLVYQFAYEHIDMSG